jgi:hypothetical protein
VPTTRERLTTVSHGLSRVQARAQQGAPPRPTPGLDRRLGLGKRSPPRPTPGLDRRLGLGKRSPPRLTSASASEGVTTSPDLGLSLGRSHRLARPRPQPDYATGDTSLPYLLLAAPCYEGTRPESHQTTPITGNDGSPHASMTSIVHKLSTEARKRQQDPCRPTSCASTGLKHFFIGHVST